MNEKKPPKPIPPPPRTGMFCKKCGNRSTSQISSYLFTSKWECNYIECKYVSTYFL